MVAYPELDLLWPALRAGVGSHERVSKGSRRRALRKQLRQCESILLAPQGRSFEVQDPDRHVADQMRTTTFLGLAAQLMKRSRAKPNSSDGIVASTTRGPFGSFS